MMTEEGFNINFEEARFLCDLLHEPEIQRVARDHSMLNHLIEDLEDYLKEWEIEAVEGILDDLSSITIDNMACTLDNENKLQLFYQMLRAKAGYNN